MTYDAGNLHGAWENLDDDSILKLEAGGDFRLTPGDDGVVSDDRSVFAVGDMSGKWEVSNSRLKVSVDPRSVRLSSSSWWKRLGLTVFSFLLRLTRARDMFDDEIIRLTDTDLWLESPNRIVTKFLKKLR